MDKKEKIINICFALAIAIGILLIVKILRGDVLVPKKVPIRQKISSRITEEVGSDTAIRQKLKDKTETDTSIRRKKNKIVDEEISRNLFVPVLTKYELAHFDMMEFITAPIELAPMMITKITSYTPEELRFAIAKMKPSEIKILKYKLSQPDIMRAVLSGIEITDYTSWTVKETGYLLSQIKTTEMKILLMRHPEYKRVGLKCFSPEELKIVLAEIKKAKISSTVLLLYNANLYSGIPVVKKSYYGIQFTKYLRQKNYPMMRKYLAKAKIDEKIINTFMTGLGQPIPKIEIKGFGEYVWNENAYIVRDYNMEVKQNDLAVFDITDYESRVKALEFVGKNKDKLDGVIIGWGNAGDNNYDNVNFEEYPAIMKGMEDFVSICKGMKPNLPVGLCVTYRENTMYQWLGSCGWDFDFIGIFNITKFGANFEKIQKRFPNQKLMMAGMNAGESQKYGGAYKNYIERIKSLGYIGSIFFK